MLAAIGAAGAIIAAPYVLPMLGIGDAETAQSAIDLFHTHGANTVGGPGLAGLLNKGLAQVPLIGQSLAAGGWGNIAATGIIGIGGMLLANWLEKRETAGQFHWSKVIRYTSLATSALIALPAVLTGISIGMTFLFSLLPLTTRFMNDVVIAGLSAITGSANMEAVTSGTSGFFAATLPHLISCGLGFFIPAGLSLWMNGKKPTTHATGEPQITLISTTPSPITAGTPATLAFQLTNAQGHPLGPEDLATTHTEKLHTMIVDRTLTDYHHLHPVYDPARKLFVCSFIPRLSQPYTAWHDFALRGTAEPIHLRTELPAPQGMTNLPAPFITPATDATMQGIHVHLATDTPLMAGRPAMLTIAATTPDGAPIRDLEPIMGAYAHLAGFSQDGKHFVHSHPLNDTPPADGRLQFHLTPETAGMTKFFLQLRHQGQDVTFPLAQRVMAPETFTARATQQTGQKPASYALA